MNPWRAFRAVVLFSWTVLKVVVTSPWKLLKALLTGGQRLLLSARAWILFILFVIVALVAYYVQSDRHTPLTTDAYVQAYVVQVAPRVEGQVVHVHVQENQAVKKGDLLFEIDRRPFQHRVDLLIAKRAEAVQQVAQQEAELAAAKAEDARLLAEEAYARTVHEQERDDLKQDATTDRKYGRRSRRPRRAPPWIAPGRRSASLSTRWRRGSAPSTPWSPKSRRSSPRPDSTWNGPASTPLVTGV